MESEIELMLYKQHELPCTKANMAKNRHQHKTPDMASFPKEISQPPGGRLIALDHFHH